MGKFKASEELDPLEYDFRPYVDATGTVPEPTEKQAAAFYARLGRNLELSLPAERLEGVELDDPYAVARVMRSLSVEEHEAMYDGLLDLYAAVCSDQPGRAELEPLPFRVRRAWYGMVQGWLHPEASTPATNS